MRKATFALCFGNRGFMPGELILKAREEMARAVEKAGYGCCMMEPEVTRFGAVETREEGRLYASWLKQNEGKYDGVVFCMPIFVDENGAVEALRDAGVPVLLQAYPDELGKMDVQNRRDAYCGKFSVCSVFTQCAIPFTVLEPHVVHPSDEVFQQNLHEFAAICRVVNGMKRFSIGAIGARTTPFKTVRYDEIALEKHVITVESVDLSEVIGRVRRWEDAPAMEERVARLQGYTDFSCVPPDRMQTLARLSLVLDEYIQQYKLDALAVRCWNELETELNICPCVVMSELNNRGIAAACEVDVCSAVAMRALSLAANSPAAVLDWNNNYGNAQDKVILFHCGPVPQTLMAGCGRVTDHKILAKDKPGTAWGSNEGRIAAFPMTFSGCRTLNGRVVLYAGEGEFTQDPIEESFFGCAGVAHIPGLEPKLRQLAQGGFAHHTSVGRGRLSNILQEAFTTYLSYDFQPLG